MSGCAAGRDARPAPAGDRSGASPATPSAAAARRPARPEATAPRSVAGRAALVKGERVRHAASAAGPIARAHRRRARHQGRPWTSTTRRSGDKRLVVAYADLERDLESGRHRSDDVRHIADAGAARRSTDDARRGRSWRSSTASSRTWTCWRRSTRAAASRAADRPRRRRRLPLRADVGPPVPARRVRSTPSRPRCATASSSCRASPRTRPTEA